LKIKVKNLKNVASKIRKDIIKALRDSDLREEIGQLYVDEVQKERKPAGNVTQEFRKYLEKGNQTDSQYSRPNINITFTGEQLEDLKKNVRAKTTGSSASYEIAQSDKLHKKYKKPDGKNTKGKRQKFSEIAGHLKDKGYDYLSFKYFSNVDGLKDKMIKLIKKRLFEKLK
jgi:hypothetical protein